MASSAPPTLRFLMILLAAASLGILGAHLWPWQEIANLPGNGTVAYDPAITLLLYIGLTYWIASGIKPETQKALSAGALIGLLAGAALIGRVMLGIRSGPEPGYVQPALLGVAIILWGIAGLRGSRAAGNAGMGALSGLWCAMMSALMASLVIIGELYLARSSPNSPDPWKDFQGLAIGNSATQGLVHSLNLATGFLLIGPLAGAAVGLIFAFFGQTDKKSSSH
jgi:hypothetical protein